MNIFKILLVSGWLVGSFVVGVYAQDLFKPDATGVIMADCFAYNDQSGNWDRLRNPDSLNKQLSWAHNL